MKKMYVITKLSLIDGSSQWLNSYATCEEAMSWFNLHDLVVGEGYDEMIYDIIEVDC